MRQRSQNFLTQFRRRLAYVSLAVAVSGFAILALNATPFVPTQPASAATATHLVVSAPSSATAGASFSITVSALDGTDTIDPTYAGTVQFTSSDDAASLPANSTLVSGTATFTVTLETAGDQSIAATDTVDSSITGQSNAIDVTAAPATHLEIEVPSSVDAGSEFSFDVTAKDQFGNTDTSYDESVTFSSSDDVAVLPGESDLSDGVATFTATLYTVGEQTISASDTDDNDIDGESDTITVDAVAAAEPVTSEPTFTG
jgi:hypothetical protein